MIEAGVPGAAFDDWLDGWSEAAMHKIAGAFWGTSITEVTDDDREACFSEPDPRRGFEFVQRLTQAAETVPEGGALAWRQYYVFAEDHRSLNSALEPAAIYQHLYARGFHPVEGSSNGVGKTDIYSNPDTLFVHQTPILQRGGPMRRITRVACAMYRPSGGK